VEIGMHDSNESPRTRLFREAVIFQLKLMADGLRDLVLVPVSMIAALAGLIRGGDQPDREFKQVIDVGRKTEHWIDLFGNHAQDADAGQSLDQLLDRAERVVREQARQGTLTESASKAIGRALDTAQEAAAHHHVRKSPKTGKNADIKTQ
jgi:hypothetical protein